MLQDFITSALIIDDKESDIKGLLEYLNLKDIWAKHYTPEQLEKIASPINNRKLVFLDLFLDEGDKLEGNISKIRKYFSNIFGPNYGSYGIVLWSKDPEKSQEFTNRIFNTGGKYTRPLFVVALDKVKYLKSNNYDNLLIDLENELLKDVSASFFIEWNKAVKKGSDNTILTLYDLFDSNDKKTKHFESVLFSLACNYTGIPSANIKDYDLQKDLVKSLMDTLQVEISNSYQNTPNLFVKDSAKLNYNEVIEERIKVFSKLNSLLLLDFQNLSQNSPIPGNLYEIIDTSSSLFINEFYDKAGAEIKLETDDQFKTYKIKRICIEVTPPCDFAKNKKQNFSRILGGIQLDYNKNLLDSKPVSFKGENFYAFLHPLQIDGYEKPQMLLFDFYRFQTIKEDDLKDANKFKIITKAKDKLFADILQKLSSHTARLGIAILYP